MAAESNNVKTLMSWNTIYSADSVEWCPIDPFFDIFVCGTYQLQKDEENLQDGENKSSESQQRLGRIYLFCVNSDSKCLEPIQTIETSAVLDQKWCSHSIAGDPYLGVVNAAGFLQIYKLLKENASYTLKIVTQLEIGQESKVLALSLDWSTGKTISEEPHVVVSDSCGNITVFIFQNGNTLKKLESWNAHSFEAWICAFNYWDPSVIYTGGDDCCFKMFDIRCGKDATVTNRHHEAGVTSLHSNAHQEHILASGSYDEKLRLWDARRLKTPLAAEALGGGIWRVKWDPIEHKALLAACMYGGFRVVETQNYSSVNIVAEYNEHSSIAYGVDWCHRSYWPLSDELPAAFQRIIGACSFYDCRLSVAQIKY